MQVYLQYNVQYTRHENKRKKQFMEMKEIDSDQPLNSGM